MRDILSIVKFLAPFKKYAVLNIVLNTLSTVFSLTMMSMLIPFLKMLFTPDSVVSQPAGLELSMDSLMTNFQYQVYLIKINHGVMWALCMISLSVVVSSLLRNGFAYAGSWCMAPISNGSVKMFQKRIYEKVLNLPLRYFSESRKGDILARFTSDVQEIRTSISGSLDMLFKDPIQIIFFLAYLIYLSPRLTVVVVVILPLIAWMIAGVGKSLKRSSSKGQAVISDMLSVMEETLSGLRIIKAFNAEEKMKSRFEKINHNLYIIQNKVFRKNNLSSPMSEFLGTVVVAFILIAGGYFVLSSDGNMESAEFITYVAVFSQILNPAKQFARTYNTIQKGMASLDRVNKILEETMHVSEIENPVRISDFKDSIEIKNVSFKYNDRYVLQNINLKIEKGKTIALVGQSGSGKSTLVDLLPRFWDVEDGEGEILLDGVNIKNYKLLDLRALMGNVNQESILFNDTIKNNIAFGVDTVEESEIRKAAEIANAVDFIEEKPERYETVVGDRGGKLSGGQRQRISIARAVLKNPPLLILDEATSALDTESERLVQDALSKVMKNRTSVVIAHRLSTIKAADEICVLHEGRIIERGKHEQLLALNGVYKKLCDMQMF